MYRAEFTVERKGNTTRRALEGKNLTKLLAKVEELNGYSVNVLAEVPLESQGDPHEDQCTHL